MRTLTFLAPLLLAGCAAGAEPAAAPPPPAFDAIAFDISSWGRPIDSWDVRADGSGRHVKMVSESGAPFREYKLEHREFAVSPAEFARLSAMAAGLAGELPECEERATDLPYGTIQLTAGGITRATRFDVGCLDAPHRAFVGQLRAMDVEVTGWADRHAPGRVEEIQSP